MKKILYITQLFPVPADSGGRIKTLGSIRSLSQEYEVILIAFSAQKPSKSSLTTIKKYVSRLELFIQPTLGKSIKHDISKLISNYARAIPYLVYEYYSAEAQKKIQQLITELKPDCIHVDHINMAQYLPQKKNEVWVLEEHNVEYLLLKSRLKQTTRMIQRLNLILETIFAYLHEKKWLKKFDWIFAISDEDRRHLARHFQVKDISTQPLIYLVQKQAVGADHDPHLLFIGDLRWPPNELALKWFFNQVYPKLVAKGEMIQTSIVGHHNPRLIEYQQLPGVTFYGYQSNINPFLNQSNIFILPFHAGGGIRIKALTALAHGLAIVSTKLGMQGLNTIPKKHYLEANSADEFVQSINQLKSVQMRKKLSNEGRAYLKKHHSMQQNKKFIEQYRKVLSSH